jgi:arsenate reductase-like glutaredoxin family protein
MAQEPRLLRRPILKHGEKLLTGFSLKEWEAAIE